MVSDRLIKLRFGKASQTYDGVANIHREIADHLIKILQDNFVSAGIPQLRNIIDIGAGTGILSEKILNLLPDSKITLLDISRDMLTVAKNNISKNNFYEFSCSYLEADIEKLDPIFLKSYDLILSSMAMQWLGDVKMFLNNCVLSNAVIAFSIPIFGTFNEWYKLLNQYGLDVKSASYRTEKEMREICNGITNLNQVDVKEYTLKFNSPLDCARYIKCLGANVSDVLYDQNVLRNFFNGKKTVMLRYKILFAVLLNASYKKSNLLTTNI